MGPALRPQPLLRVALQQPRDEGLGILAYVLRELELALLDVFVEGRDVVREVRRLSDQKLVEDCTDAVEIAFLPSSLLAQHLRGEVGRTAAETFRLIVIGLLAESEIGQPDVTLRIQQYVFGFEVPVDDVLLVEVLDGKAELCNIEFGLIFWEGDLAGEVEAKVSSGAVVEGEVEVMGGLEGEMEVDDELVVRLLQDIGLDYCVLQLLLEDQVLLLQHLESVEASV